MKKFITGFLTASLLFGSVTVFAAGGRSIEVFDAVKKIIVNKIEAPLDSANTPFIYNGTTYVPLRFVADALDIPVDWDGASGTIFVGETDDDQVNFWDTDIKHSNSNGSANFKYSHGKTNKSVASNMGNRYSNYLTMKQNSSFSRFTEITFPLNGAYSEFKGIVGCTEEYKKGNPEVLLTISLDDEEAFSKVIPMGMLEEKISVNTTGALKMTIKVQGNSKVDSLMETAIFEGQFIK